MATGCPAPSWTPCAPTPTSTCRRSSGPTWSRAIPNARLQDILDYHSTVEQAAQTATRAGVKTLVLTHYVPPMAKGDEEAWRALAAAHFSGPIVLGR